MLFPKIVKQVDVDVKFCVRVKVDDVVAYKVPQVDISPGDNGNDPPGKTPYDIVLSFRYESAESVKFV
jgi:hypothetical protein